MSRRNREGKQTARIRQAEGEVKNAERRRGRRKTAILGSVGAVLVAATVTGLVVQNNREGTGKPLLAPVGAVGDKQVAIGVGKPDAPHVVTIHEDFRCPACGGFEAESGKTLNDLADQGKIRVEYRIASFIDRVAGNRKGNGSKRAANAAACAQDAGKFREFHQTLYDNQPTELDDAFGKRAKLLDLAGKVKGLRSETFDKCVNDDVHAEWVRQVQEKFDQDKIDSTPSVLLDGKKINGDKKNPLTPEKLKQLVAEAKPVNETKPTAVPGTVPAR